MQELKSCEGRDNNKNEISNLHPRRPTFDKSLREWILEKKFYANEHLDSSYFLRNIVS